ncbi:MAG: GtrA family protein [Corallococcus sp.]|nr:GtrA family protein [Corallococcus sp.]
MEEKNKNTKTEKIVTQDASQILATEQIPPPENTAAEPNSLKQEEIPHALEAQDTAAMAVLSEDNVTFATGGADAAQLQSGKTKFLQFLKFTGFSISAGVIQFVTTGALSTWTSLIPYWIAYLIGLVLSVLWNFTFNRKFTFKAANNVPLAMGLVVVYYLAFTPISTFGADAIVGAWKNASGEGWNDAYEMVITAGMMILNFVTEFFWDKFVVFNAKVTDKISAMSKKK